MSKMTLRQLFFITILVCLLALFLRRPLLLIFSDVQAAKYLFIGIEPILYLMYIDVDLTRPETIPQKAATAIGVIFAVIFYTIFVTVCAVICAKIWQVLR